LTDFSRDREWIASLGFRIVVSEVIDHLLDPNRILRRHGVAVQKPSEIAVGCRIDIDRKSRKRAFRHLLERQLLDLVVAFRIPWLGLVELPWRLRNRSHVSLICNFTQNRP